MVNSLTTEGQLLCLGAVSGGGTTGSPGAGQSVGAIAGLAQAITAIKLFDGTSVPVKAGTGFNEVAPGSGYTTGGLAVAKADWTGDRTNFGGNANITLADKSWTATGVFPLGGGTVKGAYLTDTGDRVIAWWERTTGVTLQTSDKIIADSLQIVIL